MLAAHVRAHHDQTTEDISRQSSGSADSEIGSLPSYIKELKSLQKAPSGNQMLLNGNPCGGALLNALPDLPPTLPTGNGNNMGNNSFFEGHGVES